MHDSKRDARIAEILADIDTDADAGWCSNWAETRETPNALIVTLADGEERRFPIPPAS